MLAPVSIMHRAFCTPYRKDGMINCLLASFVGVASLHASSPGTGGWCARRLPGGRAGGFRALRELRVVAHRLTSSFGTPTSSSPSYITLRCEKVAFP